MDSSSLLRAASVDSPATEGASVARRKELRALPRGRPAPRRRCGGRVLQAARAGLESPRNHHLVKSYKFPDFKSALAFVDRVGAMAEEQGHHPDLYLAWGKVRVEVWTHKIDGLTESDFVFSAKCDGLATRYRPEV